MEAANTSKRPAHTSVNGDKEDGELDASVNGDAGTPSSKKGRRNRGGKGRSANNKKHKPAASASTTAPTVLPTPAPPSAPAGGSTAPGAVTDPLLISKPTPTTVENKVEAPAPPAAAKETEKPKPISKTREFVPRLPCKFYLKGRCEKGADCTFSHAMEIPRKLEVCKFFKSGVCRKGDECAFSHSFKDEICLYVLKGECTAGSKCKYSHDLQALADGKIAGPPVPATATAAASAAATAKPPATAPSASAVSGTATTAGTLATSATSTRPLVIALSESSEEEA